MKCLMKYDWVKLPRTTPPMGKGLMASWVKLASRAAFRKGHAKYCGYINSVNAGEWSGGIVGIKSILGVKSRNTALQTLDKLSELGYIKYDLEAETKKLTYSITDWVLKCSGEECMSGTVYTTDGYGFLCLPRNITERLVECNYIFDESDAWLDLWCHTVSCDESNAFSFLAPIIQYKKYGAALTLETLGQRWNWEKTKVWRFLKKYGNTFALYRLPGSYGCLIYNKMYPMGTEVSLPTDAQITSIIEGIRKYSAGTHKSDSDHNHFNKMVAWYSKKIIADLAQNEPENRVAVFAPIIRAYLSHCWNCNKCEYDCRSKYLGFTGVIQANNIRGPCVTTDLTTIAKENFSYG